MFNLAQDLSENTNRFAAQPMKAKALAGQLADWLRHVDAQMPTNKAMGRAVPLPDVALANTSRR